MHNNTLCLLSYRLELDAQIPAYHPMFPSSPYSTPLPFFPILPVQSPSPFMAVFDYV